MIYEGLDFDDVLIEPIPSKVNSREDVDLSVNLGVLKLKIPIIASPMKGIVSPELIIKLSELGGIGILHRFYEDESIWVKDINNLEESLIPYGASLGLNDWNKAEVILNNNTTIICVDVANGYTKAVLDFCEKIANIIKYNKLTTLLMAGNVATYQGALNLEKVGVDLVRVGIGSGEPTGTIGTNNQEEFLKATDPERGFNYCSSILEKRLFKYEEVSLRGLI